MRRETSRVVRLRDFNYRTATVSVFHHGYEKRPCAYVVAKLSHAPYRKDCVDDVEFNLDVREIDDLIVALQAARDELAKVQAEASALRKAAKEASKS